MKKFKEDETPGTLLMRIFSIRVESKEMIKYFNQIFLTFVNKVLTTSRPIYLVLMEFYTKLLPHSMAMWVKMVGKETLRETFDEAIKVEKKMSNIDTNPKFGGKKDHQPSKENKEIELNK
jgi:hypothetical protein